MLNSTIIETLNYVTPEGIPLLVRLLALFGLVYLFSSLAKTGVNLVYAVAYLIGTFKWLYKKFKREDNWD